VLAVGLRPLADAEVEETSTAPTDAHQSLVARDQRDRVAGASLIVTGHVSAVHQVSDREPQVLSEHDPDWHEAEVQVESVEKGGHEESAVTVRFPASTDVRWHASPKFTEGDEGVWLLRREQAVHTALHPLDFRGKDELAGIRQHIQAAP
jgi:hypothetical protein